MTRCLFLAWILWRLIGCCDKVYIAQFEDPGACYAAIRQLGSEREYQCWSGGDSRE